MALNGERIRTPRDDDPVQICTTCGVGFLIYQPRGVHLTPMWFTSFSESGPACHGTIRTANRQTQINNIDKWEQDNAKSQSQD